MIKINITKDYFEEILDDIKSGEGTCPQHWGLQEPRCQSNCTDCLIEILLNNTIEI